MTFRISILTLTICLLFSCRSPQNNEADFEQTVMKEIFPSLLDSMYVEIVFSIRPPRIAEVLDSVTGRKELKPVEKGELDKNGIRSELMKFKRDSIYTIIVLKDSIHSLSKGDLGAFRSKHSISNDSLSVQYLDKSYITPLKNLLVSNCFRLQMASFYKPPTKDSLMFVRELKEISFSRIIFNSDKTFGMLTCEYVCGGLCGNGYRVYIKKLNGKWEIDNIEHSWIA